MYCCSNALTLAVGVTSARSKGHRRHLCHLRLRLSAAIRGDGYQTIRNAVPHGSLSTSRVRCLRGIATLRKTARCVVGVLTCRHDELPLEQLGLILGRRRSCATRYSCRGDGDSRPPRGTARPDNSTPSCRSRAPRDKRPPLPPGSRRAGARDPWSCRGRAVPRASLRRRHQVLDIQRIGRHRQLPVAVLPRARADDRRRPRSPSHQDRRDRGLRSRGGPPCRSARARRATCAAKRPSAARSGSRIAK